MRVVGTDVCLRVMLVRLVLLCVEVIVDVCVVHDTDVLLGCVICAVSCVARCVWCL